MSSTFDMSVLLESSTILRKMDVLQASSMEDVALRVVQHFRQEFIDKDTGESALPLVRFYVTQRGKDLEPSLQDFALAAGTDSFAEHDMTCLALLASAGEKAAWNDRRQSLSHKAIPLPSVEALHRLPMVSQLVKQLGLNPRHIIEPDPTLFRDLEERTYNLFYVSEARDSEFVPAQNDFVVPYGIRSVLGFGGVLPDGMLFAVILFSSVPIPASCVEAFRAIALSVKFVLLPLVGHDVFAGVAHPQSDPRSKDQLAAATAEAKLTVALQLLDERAVIVENEALRLERELVQADQRAVEATAAQRALARTEARQTAIVEGALDCIVGMDAMGRITDFNRAAEGTFGYQRDEVIGELLSETLITDDMRSRHIRGLDKFRRTGEGPILGRRIETAARRKDGSEFPVELIVTHVAESDPPLFNGYLHDITARHQVMEELSASRERLAHIARTLQSSLLPPNLPYIPGMDLAASYRAFGDGFEVGGDFYDMFELGSGQWVLVLGDVCGKGSEAAVVTALARHTVRAAAVQHRDPAVILDAVNVAIYRQHPDRFCTAVCVVIDTNSASLELSLGGHPQPLLLDGSGTVTKVGIPGRLLGSFPEWIGSNTTINLEHNDSLLFYSDGLTEARLDTELFGDVRLSDVFASTVGLPAWDAANLVEAAVLEHAGALEDDLAMIVLRRQDAQ